MKEAEGCVSVRVRSEGVPCQDGTVRSFSIHKKKEAADGKLVDGY